MSHLEKHINSYYISLFSLVKATEFIRLRVVSAGLPSSLINDLFERIVVFALKP